MVSMCLRCKKGGRSGAYLRLGEAVQSLPLVTAVAEELRHLGAGTLSTRDVALTLSVEALVFGDLEFEVLETLVGEGLRVLHYVTTAAFDSADQSMSVTLLYITLLLGNSLGRHVGVGLDRAVVRKAAVVALGSTHGACRGCSRRFVVFKEGKCLWSDGDSRVGSTNLW